jgi:D-ribulokinase
MHKVGLLMPSGSGLQEFSRILPTAVVAPGSPVGTVTPAAAARTGLPPSCIVCAGTTDSIAAFLAASVSQPGEAVTSLGSTMAIKMISETKAESAAHGVYSHRLASAWLVGGASNVGGAVLRQHFSDMQLAELTPRLRPDQPTGLDYIPLPAPGERFPVNDPGLQPRLEPRPADDAMFLQGMLEAMARTEGKAYRLLEELGASRVQGVWTAGGGAKNAAWTELRRQELGVPVVAAEEGEASYGAALLGMRGAISVG